MSTRVSFILTFVWKFGKLLFAHIKLPFLVFHNTTMETIPTRICKFKNVYQTYPNSFYWNIQALDELTVYKKRPPLMKVAVKRQMKVESIQPGAILRMQINFKAGQVAQVIWLEEIISPDMNEHICPTSTTPRQSKTKNLRHILNVGLMRHLLYYENLVFSKVASFFKKYGHSSSQYFIENGHKTSLSVYRKSIETFYKYNAVIDEEMEDYASVALFMNDLFILHFFLPISSAFHINDRRFKFMDLHNAVALLLASPDDFYDKMKPTHSIFNYEEEESDDAGVGIMTKTELYRLAWKDRNSFMLSVDQYFHNIAKPENVDLHTMQSQCVYMHAYSLLYDAERSDAKHSCMLLQPFISMLRQSISSCQCMIEGRSNGTVLDLEKELKGREEFRVFTSSDNLLWISLTHTFVAEHMIAQCFRNSSKNKRKQSESHDQICIKSPRPTSEQAAAIHMIKEYKQVCLQGLAGSGKTTTVIREIVLDAIANGTDVTLLAPTGAAADRMSQSIGVVNASTIHRKLLQCSCNKDFQKIQGLLVVDEATMVSTELFQSLWKVIDIPQCRIVLVGDYCQLPSISHGNIFADLVHDPAVKTAHLTKVLRQANNSSILAFAAWFRHSIVHQPKEVPQRPLFPQNTELKACFLANKDRLAHYVLEELKRDPARKYHIISPLKTDTCWGSRALNVFLQRHLNPDGIVDMEKRLTEMRMKSIRCKFAIGDPIVYKKNVPDYDLCNGSIGYVRDCRIKQRPIDENSKGIHVWNATDFDLLPTIKINNEQSRQQLSYCEFILCQVQNEKRWISRETLKYKPTEYKPVVGISSVCKAVPVDRQHPRCASNMDIDLMDGQAAMAQMDKMIVLLVEFQNPKSESFWRWVDISDDRLDLAYVCTVHISQGATYEHCIIILPPPNNQIPHFYTAQLMYTAFTRASQSLILFYDTQNVLQQYAKNIFRRNTTLTCNSN